MEDAERSLPLDDQASLTSESSDVQAEEDEPSVPELKTKSAQIPLERTKRDQSPESNVAIQLTTIAPNANGAENPSVSNSNSASVPATGANGALAAILASPQASWFVRPPSGGQYGPAPAAMILEWIEQRRVTKDSLIWREGLDQWSPAENIFPELFPKSVSNSTGSIAPPRPPSEIGPKEKSAGILAGNETAIRLVRQRKNKRKRQLIFVLALLGIALALIIALVVIIFRQPNTAPL
jgi:hypothetical protein